MAGVHVSELMVYQKYEPKAMKMFLIIVLRCLLEPVCFNSSVEMFARAGIEEIEQDIERAHRNYTITQKSVRA